MIDWITPKYGSHFNCFSFNLCVSPIGPNVDFGHNLFFQDASFRIDDTC